MAIDRRGNRHRGVWRAVLTTEGRSAVDFVWRADHTVEQCDVVFVPCLSDRAVPHSGAGARGRVHLFIQPDQYGVREFHYRLLPAEGRRDRGVWFDRVRDADGGFVDRFLWAADAGFAA